MILTECINTSVVLHLNAEVDSLCIMSAIDKDVRCDTERGRLSAHEITESKGTSCNSSFCVGERYGTRVCETVLQFGSVAVVPERIHEEGALLV